MAAQRTSFEFRDPHTGELVGTAPAFQGASMRSTLYLFQGASPKNEVERMAQICLWGFLSAEADGHPVVKLPENKRKLTVDTVLGLMDEVTTDFVIDTPDDEEKEVEPNPLATPGES